MLTSAANPSPGTVQPMPVDDSVSDVYVGVSDEGDGDPDFVTLVEPGYEPDLNLPGSSQGETNGLYAQPTRNEMPAGGLGYIDANPAGRTNILDSFRNFVHDVAGTATAVQREVRQARADNKPTLGEQWNALSDFEKVGFIASVLAIAWALRGKG